MKNKTKKIKPIAYSMGNGGYEIIYKCGICEYPFTMANSEWHYCPKCNTEIDWGVIVRANEEWTQHFLLVLDDCFAKTVILSQLNKINKQIKDGQRYEMKKTEATINATRKSNAQYYLGIGWTKEELIADRGFKEEDFE